MDRTEIQPTLQISDEAQESIRAHLAGKDQEGLLFRVMTVPVKIGFSVQVGYDVVNKASRRPEFDVPVLVSDDDWEALRGFTIDVKDGRFVSFSNVTVHVAETPNPAARKFVVNRTVVREGSATFRRDQGGELPALAALLFRLEQVEALFCIQNFVTVTQGGDGSWDELTQEVGKLLQAYFAHGGAPISPQDLPRGDVNGVEQRIVRVLEDYIRPQVQRDGGDVLFAGFNEGTVSLHMQGSCVGCPSSTATLKMGIENLLKDAVPEVREVVALS